MASGSGSLASSGLPGGAEISSMMRRTAIVRGLRRRRSRTTTETGTETGTAATVARARAVRPMAKSLGTNGSKQTSSRLMPKHRQRRREPRQAPSRVVWPSGPQRVRIGGAQRSGSNGRSARWTMPASPVARASLRPSRREAAHLLLLPRSRRLGCAACSRLGAAPRHPHTRARGERPLGSVGTWRCSPRHSPGFPRALLHSTRRARLERSLLYLARSYSVFLQYLW